MERKDIVETLRHYPVGAVFNLTWDRGNGNISPPYLFQGFDGENPNLKRYVEGRNLSDYSNSSSLDISAIGPYIGKIKLDLEKSTEFITRNISTIVELRETENAKEKAQHREAERIHFSF